MGSSRDIRVKAWQVFKEKWKRVYLLYLLFFLIVESIVGIGAVIVYLSPTYMNLITQGTISIDSIMNAQTPNEWETILTLAAGALIVLSLVSSVGAMRVAQKAVGNEAFGFKTLFPMRIFGKALVMNLLKYLMIGIGMWLVIPAIIFICNYAEAEYLLVSNPKLGPIEALRLSRQKMFGNKMAYFRLIIAFAPFVLAYLLIQYLMMRILPDSSWVVYAVRLAFEWTSFAFIFAYFNIATVIFIRSIPEKNVSWNIESEPGREQKEAEENEAKLRAERRREEMNIARAERMYAEYKCSHDSMRKDGIYREYCELGLSAYREDAIRAGYARELMRRFDGDPAALQDIISISSEYAMSDLTDRALARIQRYGREANIPAAEVLEMAKQLLEMLHSGAFSEDPGFAARKQTDILNLADSIRGRMKDIEPDGEWQDTYREICSMCGMEE